MLAVGTILLIKPANVIPKSSVGFENQKFPNEAVLALQNIGQ